MRSILLSVIGLFLLLGTCPVQAQEILRMKGQFSVKSKSDSASSLTVGTFYFDRSNMRMVYDIRFPQKQLWVFKDTAVYRFAGDSLMDKTKGLSIVEFSIFNLALNNQINNYGLGSSIYSLDEVEKDGELVISTWAPPKVLDEAMGKVMIATRRKRIDGIVFLSTEGEVIRKQFFKHYQNLNGIPFPTELMDILYQNGDTTYQKTKYSQIESYDANAADFYDFELPLQYQGLLSE